MDNKNIVIFFMSKLRDDARPELYSDQSGEFQQSCLYTNETALKYIDWYLAKNNERVDGVYAFVTPSVAEKNFNSFCGLFADKNYTIEPIPFDESSALNSSFKSIGDMFDALQQSYPVEQNKVTIHLDFTGGFRHASVLMLVLLKLLQYAGYELGCVTYTNYFERTIESVRDLVELYTLIGGAGEFADNGNVVQLQNYFKFVQNKSSALEELLQQMESFSEQIKVSTNIKYLLKTVKRLDGAIQGYKQHLQKPGEGSISEQEHLFIKMLPMIEKDYADILRYQGFLASIPVFIRWCVEKGFLQQAITFCTEWLPVYIIKTGLITVNDPDIEEECKNKKLWSDWRIEFLKNYKGKSNKAPESLFLGTSIAQSFVKAGFIELNYEMVRDLAAHYANVMEIQESLGGINKKLDALLEEISAFKARSADSAEGWYNCYNSLPETSGVKYFIREGCPANNSVDKFISKRYASVNGCFDKFFFGLFMLIKKDKICQFFDIEQAKKNKENTSRFEDLAEMEQNKQITFSVSAELLAPLVNNYMEITGIRNNLNHANNTESGKKENLSLKEQILEELRLLEECEKQLDVFNKKR